MTPANHINALAALLLALVACSAPPASTLAHRIAAGTAYCGQACPVGNWMTAPGCCVDPLGDTWSACAWNVGGRHMTRAELLDPARIEGGQ